MIYFGICHWNCMFRLGKLQGTNFDIEHMEYCTLHKLKKKRIFCNWLGKLRKESLLISYNRDRRLDILEKYRKNNELLDTL